MKLHYTKILLFSLPLNILVRSAGNAHSKNKPYITTRHIPTNTSRVLSECDLYVSSYDNDPEMKAVMQDFDRQTSERFHEYDERMKTTRQKCKDKCDKEMQKIILKDKIDKELTEKFATLQTDIQSDAIPTCICEKSLEDKMEKECLKCGYGLGTVAPTVGLIGSVAVHVWKPVALKAAIKAALNAASNDISAASAKAGEAAGLAKVIEELEALSVHKLIPEMSNSIGTKIPYTNAGQIAKFIHTQYRATCMSVGTKVGRPAACTTFEHNFGIFIEGSTKPGPPAISAIPQKVDPIVAGAKGVAKASAEAARENATAAIEAQQTNVINTIFMSKQTAIIASVVAIVVIVLIMVIIYLILRYRRKKKMKKKLQYIKLLE
ncbi:hypothetical protein PFBG_00165 [Plasmodium falciparum 7G8]|uniref:Rifin n=1 Tax=Plasmodium falciparum (isolate 7G8) TaxID=57266 RepID=W7FUZ6_PLAF8|nr:hypothetical protein PFBG_00165 [Plasmodium falciparum 7G8]